MSFKELQIFDKVTSWPQLISNLSVGHACMPVCNVTSDWPHIFLHPKCFYLALIIQITSADPHIIIIISYHSVSLFIMSALQ